MRPLALLCLVACTCSAVAQPTTVPAPTSQPEEGTGPLFIAMVLAVVVLALLVGVGIVIGCLLLVLLLLLIAGGIVSTSAIAGAATNRWTTAVKALFLQIGAIAGCLCGLALGLAGNHLLKFGFSAKSAGVLGAVVGLVGGTATTWVLVKTFAYIVRRLRNGGQHHPHRL